MDSQSYEAKSKILYNRLREKTATMITIFKRMAYTKWLCDFMAGNWFEIHAEKIVSCEQVSTFYLVIDH